MTNKSTRDRFFRWLGKRIALAIDSMPDGHASSDADDLRLRLRNEERAFFTAISSHFLSLDRWRFLINLLLVGGGAGMATVARLAGANWPGNTQAWVTGIGLVAALAGGILIAFFDRDRGRLIEKTRSALALADEAVATNHALTRQVEASEHLDDKRRFLLEAARLMRETAERMPRETEIKLVLEAMMDACLQQLEGAIGFDPGEFWAISIFKKVEDGDNELMKRIVARWADRSLEGKPARSWQKGYGFTGVAWTRASDVIESDATNHDIAKHYPVPEGMRNDTDNQRYVSVAAIPIKLGATDDVWGVVTVTSDKVGRFKSAPNDIRSQYVDSVRVLAGAISLQVALRNE